MVLRMRIREQAEVEPILDAMGHVTEFARQVERDIEALNALVRMTGIPDDLRNEVGELVGDMNRLRVDCASFGFFLQPTLVQLLFQLKHYKHEKAKRKFAELMVELRGIEPRLAALVVRCAHLSTKANQIRPKLKSTGVGLQAAGRTVSSIFTGILQNFAKFILGVGSVCGVIVGTGVLLTSGVLVGSALVGVGLLGVLGAAFWTFCSARSTVAQAEEALDELTLQFQKYEEMLHAISNALSAVQASADSVVKAYSEVGLDEYEIDHMAECLQGLQASVASLILASQQKGYTAIQATVNSGKKY